MKNKRNLAIIVLFWTLFFVTASAWASGVFVERKATNSSVLIRVNNQTHADLYCFVTYNNGRNYFDFYVNRYSVSRWYFEPQGYYEWRCQ